MQYIYKVRESKLPRIEKQRQATQGGEGIGVLAGWVARGIGGALGYRVV
jgi:hypothetical protein